MKFINAVKPVQHDDVIKWKHLPRYWPFVRVIHRWPVNSPHKGQWRGTLTFSLICAWSYNWANDGDAGDLRRDRAHYDVILPNRPLNDMALQCRRYFTIGRINTILWKTCGKWRHLCLSPRCHKMRFHYRISTHILGEHYDVIKWKHFPRYWHFLRVIHRSPVDFPWRPAMRSFDDFFDLRLNNRLGKQWRHRWFETPLCSLWRHCNGKEEDIHTVQYALTKFIMKSPLLFLQWTAFLSLTCYSFLYQHQQQWQYRYDDSKPSIVN